MNETLTIYVTTDEILTKIKENLPDIYKNKTISLADVRWNKAGDGSVYFDIEITDILDKGL